ncbi:MAG: PKD domain-containing protein [Chitinophagaceae bacterium]
MATLKSLIVCTAFAASGFPVFSQDYNNIEFIENKGQWDSHVKFKGEVNAGAVFVRSGGFTILQHNQQDYAALQTMTHSLSHNPAGIAARANDKVVLRSHAFNIDFVGASPTMQVVPDKVIPAYNNYFLGNDRSKWASECRIYQAITLKDVYENVDVRYYTYNGMLKYDIIARPGADISKIALKYDGINKLQVKNKELVLSTSLGELRESYPYTYQSSVKEKVEVNCKYIVRDNIVRFQVKDYDPTATLVIDPTLIFCSFAGSSADNWGYTATYGPDGSFYGGGVVYEGSTWPVSTGAFQTTFQGGNNLGGLRKCDIGIIKLSPNGGTKVYATYVGGGGNEQPHSLIVDPQGNLIIAGRSNSGDSYPGGLAPIGSGGGWDIVVTKLNATGTGIIGSKRIGGSGDDGVNINATRSGTISLQQNYGDDGRSEVILDGGGNIYVASSTQSPGSDPATKFPTSAGAFQPNFGGGPQDAVVLKFNPNLSALLFSSYLGGNGADAAYVLSIAPSGDIYVAGGTQSNDNNGNQTNTFPGNHAGTVGPALKGGIDGFVAQISNNGTNIIRSAFIGTAGIDQVYGIQFDRNGFPYIMGQTSGAWPIVNAAYSNPGSKQFICKLQPDLSAFVYSTVFGNGSARPNISPTAFLVDRCENVYVSGWGSGVNEEPGTAYPNAGTLGLPITPDALPNTPDGRDFYFFVLKRDAAGQLYGSYFGQNGGYTDHVDGGTSRFDQNGVIYQAVCANCGGGAIFPTTPGAWATAKPRSANCNLGMIKISFNLAGVGSHVSSAIGGVPSDTAGCFPLNVVFTDQVRNATYYIWNFGDGTPSTPLLPAGTGYTQPHTFNTVGNYRVMLIAIDSASCNIRDTSYINIKVGDLKANLRLSFAKTGACTALDYQFNNLSTTLPIRPFTNSSFIWDFGDGSPQVVAGLNSVVHTFPAVGSYNVQLILNDTAYCNNPEILDTVVSVAANVDAKFETPTAVCAPYTAVFTNTSVGGQTFQWDFGDPASGANNTSTLANPTHFYAVPGVYTIRMVASDPNTCNKTDNTSLTITVTDRPTANFSYTPTTPVENTPNIFNNLSSANAVRFKWIFGDGDTLATASRSNIEHQYNASGTFNACLVAFNSVDCSDTLCMPVTTIIVPGLDIPNAFTPNSGDVNSKILVRGFGIAKMRFTIWNRWGQKVFETGNRLEGWDGKVKGVVQPMDVYAYTLDVEFFDGTRTTKKGDITLIR